MNRIASMIKGLLLGTVLVAAIMSCAGYGMQGQKESTCESTVLSVSKIAVSAAGFVLSPIALAYAYKHLCGSYPKIGLLGVGLANFVAVMGLSAAVGNWCMGQQTMKDVWKHKNEIFLDNSLPALLQSAIMIGSTFIYARYCKNWPKLGLAGLGLVSVLGQAGSMFFGIGLGIARCDRQALYEG